MSLPQYGLLNKFGKHYLQSATERRSNGDISNIHAAASPFPLAATAATL
jgi:hypothetical protein